MMLRYRGAFPCLLASLSVFITAEVSADYDQAGQGYSMRVQLNNWGVFGQAAPFSDDSIGIEYPIGADVEHLYGGGIWVGGRLDTSATGTFPPLTLVSSAYEGWVGPEEFKPGLLPADTFWTVEGQGNPKPDGWDEYWGSALPFRSMADHSLHCWYADTGVAVGGHIPLRIRIIQSTFVWNSTQGEAVQIVEFRIINIGGKQIDSAFVGFFADADVGPISVPNFFQRNCSGYYQSLETGFAENPIDVPSTPVGVTALTSQPVFQWWNGPNSPSNDVGRFSFLITPASDPDQCPSLSDTRFLLGLGPYTIRPSSDPNPDTILVAFAIISGLDSQSLQEHAVNAMQLYGDLVVGVRPTAGEIPGNVSLAQNYPNPFNGQTRITYTVGSPKSAVLRVYDVLGREVATLVDEPKDAGTHSVSWDAAGLPCGVYYYRLEAGSFVETKKLVLLK